MLSAAGGANVSFLSSGNASRLPSEVWETSLRPFSSHTQLFCLQMAVGKEQP